MLYYVSGTVTVLEPGLAVIDCGGVGYGCRVTAYTAAQLKLNQSAKLFITESIREDAFDLYGFLHGSFPLFPNGFQFLKGLVVGLAPLGAVQE